MRVFILTQMLEQLFYSLKFQSAKKGSILSQVIIQAGDSWDLIPTLRTLTAVGVCAKAQPDAGPMSSQPRKENAT